MLRAVLAVLVCAVAGCYQPRIGNGELVCADGGRPCPSGFYCAFDRTCWRDGSHPPARFWTSCGGGSGAAVNGSGATLSISSGELSVGGAAHIGGGSSFSFGRFAEPTNDTP
jgi:hypothetical protein